MAAVMPLPPVPDDLRTPAALLMLLSREALSEDERKAALALAGDIEDWPRVLRIANAKLSLPFVVSNLEALGLAQGAGIPAQDVQTLKLQWGARFLTMCRAQRNLIADVFDPLGIEHVFVKGVTLARYYGNPHLRICRDLDVLVRPERMADLIAAAVGQGHRVVLDGKVGRMAESQQEIDLALRYNPVMTLLSPEGVVIEVHTTLSKQAELFSNDALLASAETVTVAGMQCRTLPTPILLTYLCYHHNKHLWSALHWLADIAAIRAAPDFDRAAALETAADHGLAHVVETTLDFEAATRAPRAWCAAELPETPVGECLRFCALNLEGDPDAERAYYRAHISPLTDWRVPAEKRAANVRHVWKGRLSPNMRQYLDMPLPVWLHWVYPIRRMALRALGRQPKDAISRQDA